MVWGWELGVVYRKNFLFAMVNLSNKNELDLTQGDADCLRTPIPLL